MCFKPKWFQREGGRQGGRERGREGGSEGGRERARERESERERECECHGAGFPSAQVQRALVSVLLDPFGFAGFASI